jgi:hypothetical protein
MNRNLLKFSFLALGALFIAGCDDDEGTPKPSTATFYSSALTHSEGTAGTVTLGVSLDNPAVVDTEIALTASGTATAGEDYSIPASIIIPKGEMTGTIPVTINRDIFFEGDETISITMSAAGLSTESAPYVVTIQEDDCDFNFFNNLTGVDVHLDGAEGGDWMGAGAITIANTGGVFTIDGLNQDFIENWWAEEIQASAPVTFTIDGDGNITIPEQYIFTTLYDGDLYEYVVVGTGRIDTCEGTVTLDYDVATGGSFVGSLLSGLNYMTTDTFHSVFTLE